MEKGLQRKAVFPALALAAACVVALSGITYAWFVLGNTTELTGLDVNINAASGLRVSFDASVWKTKMSYSDLQAASYEGIFKVLPEKLYYPLSSAGAVENGSLKMFKGIVGDDGKLTAEAETETGSVNMIAFDVYFDMTESKYIYLDKGSKVTAKAGGTDSGSQNAVRVAFLHLGSAESSADALTINGEDVTQWDYLWEPNAIQHTAYALSHGLAVSGQPADSYLGINRAISVGIQADAPDDALTEIIPEQSDMTAAKADNPLFHLGKGIHKVRIYIWVEGQDADCNNDITSNGFSTVLNFVQTDV